MELKQKYQKLRKKYQLPTFEELDKYFEISSIEDSKFLLAAVRKKIAEKIDYFADILGNLLHPDSDFSTLYEARVFDDKEKNKTFDLYKKLMILSRTALGLSLENDEKTDAEFIKNIFKEWSSIKGELSNLIKKLKKSWEMEEDKEFKVEYLG